MQDHKELWRRMLELEKDVSGKQTSTTCWKMKADGGGHSTWHSTGSTSEVSQWRHMSSPCFIPDRQRGGTRRPRWGSWTWGGQSGYEAAGPQICSQVSCSDCRSFSRGSSPSPGESWDSSPESLGRGSRLICWPRGEKGEARANIRTMKWMLHGV